jgi:CheY-like chemotaxis protein
MRIILVDDDAFLRDMYATKFSELGHEVKVVDSGERALEEIGKSKFDVLLLDMIMPGMTGTELLQQMRNKGLSDGITSIVLSNQGEKGDIEGALNAGAKGYIIKAELIPSEVVEQVTKLVLN